MKRIYVLIIAFFLVGIFYLVIRSSFLSQEYPELLRSTELNDTIVDIVRDGRASARVTLRSKKKFTLPWAKILYDSSEVNLPKIVQNGDVIFKKPGTDTILIIQGDKKYLFVSSSVIVGNSQEKLINRQSF